MADIIIIGAGPGGCSAADYAARNGLQVVIFEKDQLGGTCLNHGCIPTKCYAHDAELIQQLRQQPAGIANLAFDIDFKAIVARKDAVTAQLRQGLETMLARPGITLVRDRALLRDNHTVVAESTGQEYTAPNIIIATGSENNTLPLPVTGHDMVVDSTQLLSEDTLPPSLCIIGAGVIGMEFASIYNALGVEVTVVEYLKECLPAIDDDIARRLRKILAQRGITFIMQAAVTAIGDGTVTYTRKGKEETLQVAKVLMAVGRKPRFSPGLDNAGLTWDAKRGIVADSATCETAVSGIYAIGDVNTHHMLAHAAEQQAVAAVRHILKEEVLPPAPMPAAIFTNPEAAAVGPSEEQCKAQGIDYICKKAYWRANGRALATGQSDGMLKLLARPDGTIISCHACGSHSADIIQEVAALICRQTTLQQLADITHIHPTIGEILHSAACS